MMFVASNEHLEVCAIEPLKPLLHHTVPPWVRCLARPPPQHLPPCVLKPGVSISGCAERLGEKVSGEEEGDGS